MKRIISVILLVVLTVSLLACGKDAEITYVPPTTATPTEPTATQPIEMVPPTEPAPTEPAVPEVLYRHPLDGSALETPWTGRPTAISMGNTKAAMPQHGINDAALIFEAEVEGASTRIMAVFGDLTNMPAAGPVRSARTFFNNLAVSLDAVMVHCGGSVRGRNGYHDLNGGKISGWEHIDARYYDGTTFYRDKDRRAAGYNLEHTMFVKGESLIKLLEKKEYNVVNEGGTNVGMTFVEDFPLTGTAANKVTVEFKAGKDSVFTYDAATGLYSASQYKQDWIDGNTNEVSKFKNLVVLVTKQTTKSDGEYPRSYYTLVGEGKGYLVIDGQMVEINWSRADLRDPISYTLTDGTAVSFEPGRTYTAITAAKTPITCE